MDLAVKEDIQRMTNHELSCWLEAEFAGLVTAGLEPNQNRFRLMVKQEDQLLMINFRQDYLNLEPRWVWRAVINILLDRQVSILTCLQVVPAFRARGLGRQIVARVEHLSRQLKMNRMWIDTPSREGEGFFKHLGYREFTSRSVMISHGQIYLIRLEKSLTDNGVL